MKGHIGKRGNRWNIVVDAGVHPETGRRRQKWYSARTKRLTERLLVEVLAELNKGSPAVKWFAANSGTEGSPDVWLRRKSFPENLRGERPPAFILGSRGAHPLAFVRSLLRQ